MANLIFLDPGGDAVKQTGYFNTNDLAGATGTVSFDTAQKVVGVGSWKFTSGANGDSAYVQESVILGTSGRISRYFRYDEVPNDPKTVTDFDATASVYSNGGFASPGNFTADDGLYATATPAKNGGQGTLFSNWGLNGTLPENADIDSVKVFYKWKVDTTSSIPVSRVKIRVNGEEGPDHDNTSEPTTDTVVEVDVTADRPYWERQDLLDGVFEVIAEARRGDTDTAHTQSWDYVKVEVGYHIPPTIVRLFGAGGTQFADIALKPKDDGVVVQFMDGAYARYDGITKLLPNTWNRISFSRVIHSADDLEIKIYINKVEELWISGANTGGAASLPNLYYGWFGRPGATKSCWFDQIAIDDGNDLLDIGNKLCTSKLPAGVNENNWTSGGTGAVNERPVNDANYKEFTGDGARQTYTLQTAAVGDVDISGENIVGYMGWARVSTADFSAEPFLVLNNLEYLGPVDGLNFLPTGNFLKQPITSASYPSHAAGIGMLSDAAGGHTVLHECGVVVAYEGPDTDDPLFPLQLLQQDTSASVSDNMGGTPPTTYELRNDIPEVAGTIITTTISSSTAEGEVPQQQAVIESNGGGEVGIVVISPGTEVSVNIDVAGADASVGLRRVDEIVV